MLQFVSFYSAGRLCTVCWFQLLRFMSYYVNSIFKATQMVTVVSRVFKLVVSGFTDNKEKPTQVRALKCIIYPGRINYYA